MPKDRRRRTTVHENSVKPAKRQFAVEDNAVEPVVIGGSAEASGNDILQSMNKEEKQPSLTKKEKQQMKRQQFLQHLEKDQAPYSKSHARRVKRKDKEEIAGGVKDLQSAISSVEEAMPVAVQKSAQETAEDSNPPSNSSGQLKPKPGQIGEGKSVPLTQAQRKRALQLERLRHPLILSNPEYAVNPFQTIRTHAQNTLLKHQPPS